MVCWVVRLIFGCFLVELGLFDCCLVCDLVLLINFCCFGWLIVTAFVIIVLIGLGLFRLIVVLWFVYV